MVKRFSKARIGVLLLALAHAACLQQLDREGSVKDLRILGIRSEPAELVDDPLPAEVRFEALVLDPRSEDPFEVELTWQFCPVESDLFCRDYNEKLASLAGGLSIEAPEPGGGLDTIPGYPDCPASPETAAGLIANAALFDELGAPNYLERYREVITGDSYSLNLGESLRAVDLSFLTALSQDLAACGLPAPPFALPQQSSDLHLYHFATNPLQGLLGVWPTVVLTAEANGETLTAQKRLPLYFRHPANPLLLLGAVAPSLNLGIAICPPGFVFEGCLAIESHTPNRNPVFESIGIRDGRSSVGGEFETFWTPADGDNPADLPPRRIERGSSIRIRPVFTPDSEETFQRFSVDPNNGSVSVVEETEKLSVGWFSTGGIFRDETTWVEGTVELDTALDTIEAGLFHVFMVARDQRGGTTWKGFRVEVVE